MRRRRQQLLRVPCSMIVPASITRMRSASTIVESRWAMTKLVRPCISASIARTMACSVRVSTLDVASSRIKILGSHSIARAMVSNCR